MVELIKKIRLGFTNCYLLKGKSVILIDAGLPNYHNKFIRKIKNIGLTPQDVKLIIITHGHFDHFGSAMKLKEITGAKLAIHKLDSEFLKEGKITLPGGLTKYGRFLSNIMKSTSFMLHVSGVEPDIILDDEYSLEEFGINGKVIHTPGHTQGSISIILDSGEAFVGDLAMNSLLFRFGPGAPIFGDSMKQVHNSWQKLINAGAQVIYPGHGNGFSVRVFEEGLGHIK